MLQRFRNDARNADSLSSDQVRALLEDRAGHLWVGTASGLDLLDRSTGDFSHYRSDRNDAQSLRDSFVMSLYQDDTGLVWIGTRAGGVSRWNPRSWELGGHRPSWLGTGPVTAFADAPDNAVWVASFGGGISRFDSAAGKATPIADLVRDKHALAGIRVMSMLQDHRGTLWAGTLRQRPQEESRATAASKRFL